ncbi:MAG: FG-GAP repeat protein [Pseudomonadota bacterium]
MIDPIRPNILYTGGFCDGVFRSTDRGATWISLPTSGFCIESIALSPVNNARLINDDGRLTNNGGQSWDRLSNFFGGNDVVFGPNGDLIITAGFFGGPFFRPIDARAQTLLPDDAEEGDGIGSAVAVSGDLYVLGVPGDDDSGTNAGAVLVFQRDGTDLNFLEKILVPEGFSANSFGASLALQGNILVVGAPGNGPIAKGTERMQAAVFERLGGVWSLKTPIVSSGGSADDEFGATVSIDGSTVAVGAPGDNQGEPGEGSGAAYVFDFDGSTATLLTKEKPPSPVAGARFGEGLDLKNGVMAVGAPRGQTLTGALAGTVSLYDQITNNLRPLGTVEGDGEDNDDEFGAAVSLSGSRMIIGAPGEGGDAGDGVGAAYAFVLDGDFATRIARLQPDDTEPGDEFGRSVDIAGERAIVGAPQASAVEGIDSGAAYLFAVSDNAVEQQEKLAPLDDDSAGGFGTSVAISDTEILIGAPASQGDTGAAQVKSDTELVFGGDFEPN